MSVTTTRVADGTGRPAVATREAKRLPQFDGVRAVCALALLVVHVAWTAGLTGSYTDDPNNLPAAILINGFQVAVGVFFLLSGLFLYRPFAQATIAGTQRPKLRPYLLRRLLRLLPAYYVVTAVALLVLNYSSIDGVWYVLRPVLLMQNYDPLFMVGMDITWTVVTEVHWYLALPLIAFLNHLYARRGATPASRARRLMIAPPLLVLVGFAWTYYIHTDSMGPFPPEYWWPVSMAANFGVGLALGVMSALTRVSPKDKPALFGLASRRPGAFWFAALIVFAINCAEPFGRPGYGDYDTMGGSLIFYALLISFGTLILLPMIAPGTKSRMIDVTLTNRPIVYLGRISYGIYLWHFIVLNLYLGSGSIFDAGPQQLPALRGTVGFWELEAAVLIGTVIVASLSYYLIERPILNFGERRLNAKKLADQAPVPVVPAQREAADRSPASVG